MNQDRRAYRKITSGDNQTITGRKFFAKLNASDANVHAGENFDAGMFTDIVLINEPAVINGDLEIQGKFHSADSVIKGLSVYTII